MRQLASGQVMSLMYNPGVLAGVSQHVNVQCLNSMLISDTKFGGVSEL